MKARFTIDVVQVLTVVGTLLLGIASVAFVQAAAINMRLLFLPPIFVSSGYRHQVQLAHYHRAADA